MNSIMEEKGKKSEFQMTNDEGSGVILPLNLP